VTWWTVPVYILAAVLFHAGTNVLNDFYDYRHGVDGPQDPDPTHAISQGVVSPRFMLASGRIYFVLGILLGAVIAGLRGPGFFAVGLVGAAGAYYYTNARFSLKYRALGDVAVFLLMGPALVFIGMWALVGSIDWGATVASLPIAFLVTAILHGNNMRDISVDHDAGVDTVAGRLGFERSKWFFWALVGLAYLTVPVLIAVGTITSIAVVSWFSIPPALRLLIRVRRVSHGGELMDIPLQCAKLHMLFSVLYIAGIFAGAAVSW
jgi:1,4-dihydroxy-2-naphthoate octaprenyltransferase